MADVPCGAAAHPSAHLHPAIPKPINRSFSIDALASDRNDDGRDLPINDILSRCAQTKNNMWPFSFVLIGTLSSAKAHLNGRVAGYQSRGRFSFPRRPRQSRIFIHSLIKTRAAVPLPDLIFQSIAHAPSVSIIISAIRRGGGINRDRTSYCNRHHHHLVIAYCFDDPARGSCAQRSKHQPQVAPLPSNQKMPSTTSSSSPSSTVAEAGDSRQQPHTALPIDPRPADAMRHLRAQQQGRGLRPPGHRYVRWSECRRGFAG